MKGTIILSALVAMATVCSGSHSGKLPGLVKMLDRAVEGFGSCTTYCLARRMKEIQSSFGQRCIPFVNETFVAPIMGQTYEAFYSQAFTRLPSGKTQMCTWATQVFDVCVSHLLDPCSTEVQKAYKTTKHELLDYVCSTEPPILECAMSPALIKKQQELATCTKTLVEKFGRHFSSAKPDQFLKAMENFYKLDVKPNNGALIFSEISTLTTCMTSKVQEHGRTASGGNCASASSVMMKEVGGILNYFKKTDILSCGLNPVLWKRMMDCVEKLMQDAKTDPNFSPRPTQYPGQPDPLTMALLGGEYYKFRDLWDTLQMCIKTAVLDVCGQKWVYKFLNMELQAADAVIYNKAAPGYCSDLTGGSGVLRASTMTVASMILFMMGATSFL